MKQIVSTDKAPAAIGPYSQAVWAGPFLFVSGQIPIDPATGSLVEGDVTTQAERVLKNIEGILASQNLSFEEVAKATVFATDMNAFASVNEVYARFFSKNPPARSFVQVAALPRGAQIEIEVIAYRG